MKRIIKGVTYNTDTGTKLAKHDFDYPIEVEGDPENPMESNGTCTLYQTRGGAFFIVEEQKWVKDPYSDDYEVTNEFATLRPVCTDDAQSFIVSNSHDVDVFHNPFADPPEAEGDQKHQTEATIYARVPASLKARIEEVSDMNNLSMNSYVIRCLEKCLGLAPSPQPPYNVF